MSLTICYVTSRKDCKFEWFAQSLWREAGGRFIDLQVIVVDFYAQVLPWHNWTAQDVQDRRDQFARMMQAPLVHVNPKPTVWSGPHRLTTQDYFAAANTRNTGIALASSDHIAFCDDLSVLKPGWLSAVRHAIAGNYICCGAYRKVVNLKVENGNIISFDDYKLGHDYRWLGGNDSKAMKCPPQWFCGCSLVAPMEAFLKINGYPESSDSLGYEDCITGQLISRHGYDFRYDRRMMTYESEPDHHFGYIMKREDPGESPNDMSHALLAMLASSNHSGNNYDLRELRQKVLAGEAFPVSKIPEHRWFDGKPLREL